MSDRELRLIEKAGKKFGPIRPCGGSQEWKGCFSEYCGKTVLWFNTADDSTHIEMETKK